MLKVRFLTPHRAGKLVPPQIIFPSNRLLPRFKYARSSGGAAVKADVEDLLELGGGTNLHLRCIEVRVDQRLMERIVVVFLKRELSWKLESYGAVARGVVDDGGRKLEKRPRGELLCSAFAGRFAGAVKARLPCQGGEEGQ